MNFSTLFPLTLIIIPIIPALLEIFRRKDKGPRKIPEETIYGEKCDTSKPLPALERWRAAARIKGPSEVIRIVGDISIPDGTEIREPIVVHGFLRVGKRCHLYGNIKSSQEIEVGEESIVEGHILSDGKVTIGPKATVKGIVDSTEDIILKEGATVEAVSTEKSVITGSGAKILREIKTGVPVRAAPTPPKESRPETPIIERLERLSKEEKPTLFPSAYERFLQAREGRGFGAVKEPVGAGLTEIEAKVLRLLSSGRDIYEIGLALLLDPAQVRDVIRRLVEKKYLTEDLRLVGPEEVREETERLQPEASPITAKKKEEEPTIEEVFESLLSSKMRDEVKKRGLSKRNLSEEDPSVDFPKKNQAANSSSTGTTMDDSEESLSVIRILHEAEKALKEWQRASSVLFEEERERTEEESSGKTHEDDQASKK